METPLLGKEIIYMSQCLLPLGTLRGVRKSMMIAGTQITVWHTLQVSIFALSVNEIAFQNSVHFH